MTKAFSNLLFLIATAIWGFAFVAQKAASDIPAFTLGALRSILAAIFLLAMIPLTDRATKNGRRLFTDKKRLDISRDELIGGSILGVILVIASACQQIGIETTEAGKTAFITGLYVVIVPIVSSFFGKKPHLNAIISVPVAVIGFYFLCIKPGSSLETSDLLILMCAFIFTFHIITVDHYSPKCDGVRLSLVQFSVATILNGAVGLVFEQRVDIGVISTNLLSILYLGMLSSGIAYTLQILAQRNADPTVSSIFLSLESVFGVVGAAVLLGEQLEMREYIGCVIVFIAILISQIDFIELIKRVKTGQKDN
jgi:drug/metabolite transporter (DMT)-like permease